MKKLVLCCIAALSGCANMTPREKLAIGICSAVIVEGAIAANRAGKTTSTTRTDQPVHCGPNGISCQ